MSPASKSGCPTQTLNFTPHGIVVSLHHTVLHLNLILSDSPCKYSHLWVSCFSKCEFRERTLRLVLLGNVPCTKCLQLLVTSEWSSDKTSHYLPALWYALWHVEGPKIVANLQRTTGHVPKIRIPKALWWNMQNTKIIHLLVFVVASPILSNPSCWLVLRSCYTTTT